MAKWLALIRIGEWGEVLAMKLYAIGDVNVKIWGENRGIVYNCIQAFGKGRMLKYFFYELSNN